MKKIVFTKDHLKKGFKKDDVTIVSDIDAQRLVENGYAAYIPKAEEPLTVAETAEEIPTEEAPAEEAAETAETKPQKKPRKK